jgi:4-amino-4-deoxy-L-arabinose transferase-like glycosyltransferase
MLKMIKENIAIRYFVNKYLLQLLIIAIVIMNAYGLFSPILASNDASFYSVIAKHIVISNDWVNLTFNNQDWLDKPHLPFWLTAISYKIFGINVFAYIFPGFLFYLIGGYYTYRLAKYLYNDQVGLLASLIYLSSLRLMLSSIDIRAEAYLLGEIVPACYYWLRYHNSDKIRLKYLIIGAIFTAMALMTKGLFVLLTISSGLITTWVYERKISNLFKPKWLLALLLSFIFALPEFVSLYLQFDLHPEKLVFGKHSTSGVKFFFLDSQFGRFFDTGPITSGKHQRNISHYFFFIHTFIWAFLPWSLNFFSAIVYSIKKLRIKIKSNNLEKFNVYYLFGSFIPTFILFSLTKFQLDHYTNILIPFASVLCAAWIYSYCSKHDFKAFNGGRWVFQIQIMLAFSLLILISGNVLFFSGDVQIYIGVMGIITILLFLISKKMHLINKAIVFSIFAISLVFIFVMLINNKLYVKYDAGYQVAKYLNSNYPRGHLKMIDNVGLSSLEFHLKQIQYQRADNLIELNKVENNKNAYYILIKDRDKNKLLNMAAILPRLQLVSSFSFIPQNKFISSLMNFEKDSKPIQVLLLYKVN